MTAATFWNRLRHALGHYPTTALDWAVRVQAEDVTRQELLALEEWLNADPRNADAYARMKKIAHLGLMYRDHPLERQRLNTYRRSIESAIAPKVIASRPWSHAAAGAAAFGLVALLVLLAPDFSSWANRYEAGRGEQRNIALADGSRVLVNTDSEVRVDYHQGERGIELIRGEAYFEVAKDPARPFVVRTEGALVRALGTKFTVRRIARETEVVVTEGRVQVLRDSTASGAPLAVQVDPGKRAVVSSAQPGPQIASIDTARATAWTVGNVEFEDAHLAEVIHDVNRYSVTQLVMADPTLTSVRVTGRFRIGDLESVKFALQDRFGIVAIEQDGAVRLSRNH